MAKPAPPANAITQTFQVGSYSPLGENANSDGFTLLLDMNDGVTWQLMPTSIQVQRQEQDVRSDNIRVPGEYVVANQYKNMMVSASFSLSRKNDAQGTAQANMVAQLRTLISVLKNPPFTLRYAYPQATQYSYADVVKVHGIDKIPLDPILWNNKTLLRIDLAFECAYGGWRGDRVTLTNLAVNPGFEAPAGGGTAQTMPTAFNDSFANVNAYAVQAGSAPTVAANVMTLVSGARVAFGSPAWGAMQMWQVRFQFLASQVSDWYLHFTDVNNFLDCFVSSGSITLRHLVGGTTHTLASGTISLTANNFYWIRFTQYPTVSGNAPMVEVQIFNDSSGTVGSAVASSHLGPIVTFDAVTALVGRPQISTSGASLPIGGAFSNVHTVSLFGPGGWTFGGLLGSATGSASGAWDGSRSELGMSGNGGGNTHPNGPVTSFGAARIDAAPAGTLDAKWNLYAGGAPAGTQAIPVKAATDVIYAAAAIKSSGLGNGATIKLVANEYDASGTNLNRPQTLATFTVSGAVQAAYPSPGKRYGDYSLKGNWTTGASCAYVDVGVELADTTAGSANGTVWIDSVLSWDSTNTVNGETNMSYHEVRSPNSPAQLMVSGLLGDYAAPCLYELGAWVPTNGLPNNGTLLFYTGRRFLTAVGAQFIGSTLGDAQAGNWTPVLDSASLGGVYGKQTNTGNFAQLSSTLPLASIPGDYHLFSRFQTNQSGAPLAAITAQWAAAQNSPAGNSTNSRSVFNGSALAPNPFALVQNTWDLVDAGGLHLPLRSPMTQTDLTQFGLNLYNVIVDTTGSTILVNALALLPVDGGLLTATVKNVQGAAQGAVWYFLYLDGCPPAAQGGGDTTRGAGPLAMSTTTGGPLFQPAIAGYGPSSTTLFNPTDVLLNTGDPWLTLDPVQAGAVNQFCAICSDNVGTIYPTIAEIQYSPYYLDPR